MEPAFVQGKEYGEIIEKACPLVQGKSRTGWRRARGQRFSKRFQDQVA